MSINYDFRGLDDVVLVLEEIGENAADPTNGGWDLLHQVFLYNRIVAFNTAGASQRHGPWIPNRRPNATLIDTGRLRASLTNPNHPDHVYVAAPTHVEIGTDVPYAVDHQYGQSGLPIRRVIDPSDAELDAYADVIANHILGK